jgi:hypothetical protein
MMIFRLDIGTVPTPIETSDFRNQSNIPYWYRKNPSAVSIETTSYALLTQLELDNSSSNLALSHNFYSM